MGVAGVLDLTPAMRQYMDIKQKHFRTVSFFPDGRFL